MTHIENYVVNTKRKDVQINLAASIVVITTYQEQQKHKDFFDDHPDILARYVSKETFNRAYRYLLNRPKFPRRPLILISETHGLEIMEDAIAD